MDGLRRMAPNEDNERLDEHGRRLDRIEDRLNVHSTRFDRFDLVLQGDEKVGVKGLVQAVSEMNDTLRELVDLRDKLVIYWDVIRVAGRWTLILLALIGAGVWWPTLAPYLQAAAKLLGV